MSEISKFEELNNVICNAQLRERKMILEIITSLRKEPDNNGLNWNEITEEGRIKRHGLAQYNEALEDVEDKIRLSQIYELKP